jgi:CBS domain-containing protein
VARRVPDGWRRPECGEAASVAASFLIAGNGSSTTTGRTTLPSLGAGDPVAKAVEILEGHDALMVHDDGKPVGVLTRQDLLGHLSG